MTHSRLGAILVAGLLAVLLGSPTQPAPLPKDKPTLRLTLAGEMKLSDLRVEDAAVIDENTVVLVGTKQGAEDDDPDKLDPNGALINLAKKSSRPFTNGHTARICSVSVARGRVATVSTKRDPVLRIWDLKASKTAAQIEINKLIEKYRQSEPSDYAVAWFHKSDRIAIGASEYVLLLNPAKTEDVTRLETPLLTRRDKRENVSLSDWFTKDPLAVSPDDAWVACPVGMANVVFWDVATGKPTDVTLIPKGADNSGDWLGGGVRFGPSGSLFAWRTASADEVPEKVAEKDVPADRRGIVQIDLPKDRLIPLGMGQTIHTLSCAIDPTGTWLATGGNGHPDRPRPNGDIVVGEFRVYHLPSGELAYREQPKDSATLTWLSFTASGKRLVGTSPDGVVKWWDVSTR